MSRLAARKSVVLTTSKFLGSLAITVAARLTVIISQSAIRDPQASDAEETLLAEIMMAAGLDATLIGSLDSIQPESTDYLCLSGFTQSLAICTWLSAEEVSSHWLRLGLPGAVIAAEVQQVGNFGNEGENGSGRRVYCFSLRTEAKRLLRELQSLLVDRNVKTVNVMLPKSSSTLGTSTKSATSIKVADSVKPQNGTPAIFSEAVAASSKNAQQSAAPHSSTTSATTADALPNSPDSAISRAQDSDMTAPERQWCDLDNLVDELDSFDF